MSIVASEMTPADIAAVTSGGNGGWGNGFGGDGWWIILLFLLAFNGNGFGGGFGGNGGGMLPYYFNNTDNNVSRGFADAAITSQLGDIQSSIAAGFANAEVAECNRTMNLMNQRFSDVQAVTGAVNGVSAQLANCCCENRLATANLSALVQSENCADRAALSDGIRDIIQSQTQGVQKILDTMCQDKIDAKNERIQSLEQQLTMAQLAASQTAQTAQLLADNNRQTAALEQYLNPVPIPAYIVQNPNCCTNTCGCGF